VWGLFLSGVPDAPAQTRKPTDTIPLGTDRVRTDAEMRALEADNIRAALRQAKGKVSGPGGAAELLDMKPTTLASRIKASGLAQNGAIE
jgi:transcriptional regulator with GAF, ATPase, and Fis domain